MTSKPKAPTKSPAKHPLKTFERKAGAMPTLKRTVPAAAPLPAEPAVAADEQAKTAVPGFLSQREVLLRLVETLKQL